MSKTTTLFYHEWADLFKEMSAQDTKTILVALLEYDATGKKPEVSFESNIVSAIYKMMLEKVEKNHLLYAEKCEKLAKNGALGGRPKKDEKAKKAERIGKEGKGEERIGKEGMGVEEATHTPTLEELRSFCQKEGLDINAEKFWNYYEGISWQRNGQPINWQAQARFWDSQDKENRKATPFQQFSQRPQDFDNVEDEWLAQ